MENENNKGLSIKSVVAIGIGAAIFFVLGRFVAIPSGVPNTNITIQYALLALFATIYGPIVGTLVGFVGHVLIDLSWGGSPWWSWVLASAVIGLVIGIVTNKINLDSGEFDKKSKITFVVACLIANIIAWVGVAPTLDIFMYAEPSDKVYLQGMVATVINFVSSAVIGGILAIAYTKTRVKAGSLSIEDEVDSDNE